MVILLKGRYEDARRRVDRRTVAKVCSILVRICARDGTPIVACGGSKASRGMLPQHVGGFGLDDRSRDMIERVVQDDAHVFDWAIAQIEQEIRDDCDLQALDAMTESEWQAWVALPECDAEAFREV